MIEEVRMKYPIPKFPLKEEKISEEDIEELSKKDYRGETTLPLWVVMRRSGGIDTIERLIRGEEASSMTVNDVVNHCLKSTLSDTEKIAASRIKQTLEQGDSQLKINQFINVSPQKSIFAYARGKVKGEIRGKEISYIYADIEVSAGGELRLHCTVLQ